MGGGFIWQHCVATSHALLAKFYIIRHKYTVGIAKLNDANKPEMVTLKYKHYIYSKSKDTHQNWKLFFKEPKAQK